MSNFLRNNLFSRRLVMVTCVVMISGVGVFLLVSTLFFQKKINFWAKSDSQSALNTKVAISQEELKANLENILEADSSVTYDDPEARFSFGYPKSFKVGNFENDDEAETILIQQSESDIAGLQIYLMPFDESGALTQERILKDLPDLKIQDSKNINVADVPAITFTITDGKGRKTREVWFVKSGWLYQASSYIEAEKFTEKVLQTWQWK